jgi:hypothetical protein
VKAATAPIWSSLFGSAAPILGWIAVVSRYFRLENCTETPGSREAACEMIVQVAEFGLVAVYSLCIGPTLEIQSSALRRAAVTRIPIPIDMLWMYRNRKQ